MIGRQDSGIRLPPMIFNPEAPGLCVDETMKCEHCSKVTKHHVRNLCRNEKISQENAKSANVFET